MFDVFLLILLIIFAIYSVREKDLLSSIIILSGFSLMMTILWTRLNAVDVAFTEASVGAGVSTVIFLAAISRTKREEEVGQGRKRFDFYKIISLFIVILTGLVLAYGTFDMPPFGDIEAPVNTVLAPRYIYGSVPELGIKNFVTSILASYRGYDTLGETTVILTAGISVVILLRRKEL